MWELSGFEVPFYAQLTGNFFLCSDLLSPPEKDEKHLLNK